MFSKLGSICRTCNLSKMNHCPKIDQRLSEKNMQFRNIGTYQGGSIAKCRKEAATRGQSTRHCKREKTCQAEVTSHASRVLIAFVDYNSSSDCTVEQQGLDTFGPSPPFCLKSSSWIRMLLKWDTSNQGHDSRYMIRAVVWTVLNGVCYYSWGDHPLIGICYPCGETELKSPPFRHALQF